MTKSSILGFWLLILCSCNQRNSSHPIAGEHHLTNQLENKAYSNFKLYYSFAGLGFEMGTMQPTFRVSKNNYVYTYEQNSFYSKPDRQPTLKCKGSLRNSSIDSIMNIVKAIQDTVIYKTNTGIQSGGIHNLSIEFENKKVAFELHNAYDSTAQQILDILNSNIPPDKERLWLFHFAESKYPSK